MKSHGPTVALSTLCGVIVLFAAELSNAESSKKSSKPITGLDHELTQQFDADIKPLLKRYCFECHQGESAESSVDLSKNKSLDKVRLNPSQWEQVRGLVRIGAMPPPDAELQPTEAERQIISQWVYRALNEFDCNESNPPAPITVRRLNSIEYDNTIRDLFGLEMTPSKTIGFVSDDVGNGFDNQGEVLSISPLAFEKYVNAAEWIANQAVVVDLNTLREQSASGDPIQAGQIFVARFLFAEGDYEIKTKLRSTRRSSDLINAQIFLDDEELDIVRVPADGRSFSKKLVMTPGEHAIRIQFADEQPTLGSAATLTVEYVNATGPSNGIPPLPKHHERIMIAKSNDEESAKLAAQKIVDAFLPRAYRRPVTKEESKRIVDTIHIALDYGSSLEESVQFGLQAILVAPEFLFRIERRHRLANSDRQTAKNATVATTPSDYPIDEFDLATRLSYFLWSTMPDERLFELAKARKLARPDVLQAEIERMLESPKADALVSGFFSQWLGLRNLQTVSVDEDLFDSWSDKLSAAFANETILFCKDLLRHGKLLDVLDADFTFVNPRLADFYNLPFDGEDASKMYQGSERISDYARRLGSYRDEDRWIRVELPNNRRGLLTQASVLTLTSNPTRTSPVKRGKWVLENILGDPAPPAPPGVPSLEEGKDEHKKLSLRQQLEIHRANPSCASCHRVLDPIGLGLENFDAIGCWRTTDDGLKIDADGEFADGRKFSGPRELLEHLQIEKPKIARHFAAQLLTYALGRGMTRGDSCTLDSIVLQAADDDYQISTFINAIITSKPFRNVGVSTR
ncbi:MAG: DUF1592 domain-containing protein [Pirellulaceae bacterium]|nr:DUF1592 domain-containing protein [Pirellulaceae bacterium]